MFPPSTNSSFFSFENMHFSLPPFLEIRPPSPPPHAWNSRKRMFFSLSHLSGSSVSQKGKWMYSTQTSDFPTFTLLQLGNQLFVCREENRNFYLYFCGTDSHILKKLGNSQKSLKQAVIKIIKRKEIMLSFFLWKKINPRTITAPFLLPRKKIF